MQTFLHHIEFIISKHLNDLSMMMHVLYNHKLVQERLEHLVHKCAVSCGGIGVVRLKGITKVQKNNNV